MTIELSKRAVDIGIVVADIASALEFYCDVIGLESHGTLAMPDGGTMHRLHCGDSIIKVIEPPAAAVRAAPGGISGAYGFRFITIWAVEVDEVIERCRTAGRHIVVEPWEFRPGVVVGIVEDPEGNTVEVVGTRE